MFVFQYSTYETRTHANDLFDRWGHTLIKLFGYDHVYLPRLYAALFMK